MGRRDAIDGALYEVPVPASASNQRKNLAKLCLPVTWCMRCRTGPAKGGNAKKMCEVMGSK